MENVLLEYKGCYWPALAVTVLFCVGEQSESRTLLSFLGELLWTCRDSNPGFPRCERDVIATRPQAHKEKRKNHT